MPLPFSKVIPMAKDKTANQEEKCRCNAPMLPLIGEPAP